MARIIVVEDNPIYNDYVCNLLGKEGIESRQAYSLGTARKLIREADERDVVLADLRLPDGNGTDLLRWMLTSGKRNPFLVMTDYGEVHTAVESMKLGARDYLQKSLLEERLVPVVRSLLKEEVKEHPHIPLFVRQSAAYQEIKRSIRLVSPTRMGVLVQGENGTGKELVARQIHDRSKQAGKPFITVDCGTLSPQLAASALFGHVKGAFTGADSNKRGYFDEAKEGTLFLDEVGNLPCEVQQMLLRAIQSRTYRPVGADGDKTADVRIIAATNEDLALAIEEKRFRRDLYFRLREFVINVPPLRECREEILPMAEFFLSLAGEEFEKDVNGFDSEARKALLSHSWTGNIRELKQTIRSAVLMAEDHVVRVRDLHLESPHRTISGSLALRSEETEKEKITKALEQCGWNREMAAGLLGIGRTTLYQKMIKYGIAKSGIRTV